MELKGKIIEISATQQVTESFKKREFVLEYAENPQYPEYLKMEFVQDKCDLLDKYELGQDVTVSINLRGRSYVDKEGTKRYFNSIQAWRITGHEAPKPQDPNAFIAQDDTDDLPF